VDADASELVSIPRAELDGLRAELKRLRREAGRRVSRDRIKAGSCRDGDVPALTRAQLAEAWGISDDPR
jgi:hypothetical protein